MKGKANAETIDFFILAIVVIVQMFGVAAEIRQLLWIGVLLLHIGIIIYCMFDMSNRVALAIMNVTILLFDTASMIVRSVFETGLHVWYIESDIPFQIEAKSAMIYSVSIIVIFIGHVFAEKNKFRFYIGKRKGNAVGRKYEWNIQRLRRASRMLFYITVIPWFLEKAEVAIFVMKSGSYLAYYSSFASRLPGIIGRLSNMCLPSFYFFCATMPKKNEFRKVMYIALAVSLLSAFSGQRNQFALFILFLMCYSIVRGQMSDGKEWFTYKMWFKYILIIPVVVLILIGIYNMRNGGDSDVSLLNNIIIFFTGNESGFELIYELEHHNLFPKQNYVFGPVIRFLDNNIIGNWLGLSKDYWGNTVYMATYGHAYEFSISYLVMPYEYLSGQGIGGNFLAEVMHDYSYCGVIIISMLYGFLLGKLPILMKKFRSNPIILTISLQMLTSIWFSPRSQALAFITDSFLSFNMLLTWACIYLLSRIRINGLIKNKRYTDNREWKIGYEGKSY